MSVRAACVNCRGVKVVVAKGLCSNCYQQVGWRFPARFRRRFPPCVACGERSGCRPRGMCCVCYYSPVRHTRPTKPRGGDRRSGGTKILEAFPWLASDREPTEEQLDELIAYQSRPENLPKWWKSESTNP